MSSDSRVPSDAGRDVLVTGGAGLLGSALRPLLPGAVFATRADADLTDAAATRRLFARHRPRRVLHLAARVGGVRFNRAHNADLLASNVRIDLNVLTAAREAGVDRLVGVLSSCAFHIPPDRPAAEADVTAGQPFAGNLGYGLAKRLLDAACRLWWEQDGCRFSTIAPVTMYGPHDNFDLEDGHVVGALIHRCALAREAGRPLVVWGTGEAVRQFVYAPDVARVLVRELEAFDGPDTTVVAPDAGLPIRDLAHAVARAMAFTGGIEFTGDLEGQRVKALESRRFAARHPAFAFTPLAEGLAATARWFTTAAGPVRGRSVHVRS